MDVSINKEILALEVADEKAHDGKEMNALVKHILNRDNINYKIRTVLADGAYSSNKSFGYPQNKNFNQESG